MERRTGCRVILQPHFDFKEEVGEHERRKEDMIAVGLLWKPVNVMRWWVNDDKASRYQDIVLWASCVTRSCLDSFGHTHRSPSLFIKQRSLLIAFWDWLYCSSTVQTACSLSHYLSRLTVWPTLSTYYHAFCCWWCCCWLAAEGRARGKSAYCPVLSSLTKKSPSQLCSSA